ncbi:Region-like protein isoform 1 [Dorcoceras hygrometricum]|uniref:Region-like protein isoform 1 n=1 Tax=Dorcoceras hygrometricum TaxID=472368 RepID=A0A2Z7CXV3_9LAMI|nr:Region-like protein isoform 1 [Dorcoceras hygrometricum]
MVKRLATSPHDPLGITDSACKNQSIVVSVQYGPFNPYIPIRSTTIGKSRVAIDPIAMHTSWRSNSDITSVTSIGYPRMSASGESSTTMHRLLHASGSHPIPTPYDPNWFCELAAGRWRKPVVASAALFRALRAKRQRFDKLVRRRLDVATGTSCEDLFACVCRLVVQLRADVNAGQRSYVATGTSFWKDFTREKPADGFRRPADGIYDDLLSVLGFDPMSLWGLVCFPCLLCCPGYSAGRGASPAGGAPGGG